VSERVRNAGKVEVMAGATLRGWVKIDEGIPIRYDVCGEVVEFDLGLRRGEFQLVATEHGLAKLIAKGSEALQALRDGNHDTDD
jgi:hypothetical protein